MRRIIDREFAKNQSAGLEDVQGEKTQVGARCSKVNEMIEPAGVVRLLFERDALAG